MKSALTLMTEAHLSFISGDVNKAYEVCDPELQYTLGSWSGHSLAGMIELASNFFNGNIAQIVSVDYLKEIESDNGQECWALTRWAFEKQGVRGRDVLLAMYARSEKDQINELAYYGDMSPFMEP